MLKLKQSILTALLCGALTTIGNAEDAIDLSAAQSATGPTATAILSTYRAPDQPYLGASDGDWHRAAFEARSRAENDLDYARAQLAQARAEVVRLVAEIKIEGAETVDIGGEVRAARMVEAEWKRAVDILLAHIGKIDAAIVMRGGEPPQGQLLRQSLR